MTSGIITVSTCTATYYWHYWGTIAGIFLLNKITNTATDITKYCAPCSSSGSIIPDFAPG